MPTRQRLAEIDQPIPMIDPSVLCLTGASTIRQRFARPGQLPLLLQELLAKATDGRVSWRMQGKDEDREMKGTWTRKADLRLLYRGEDEAPCYVR